MHDLTDDERHVVALVRRAREHGHSDLQVTYADGHCVKLWLTLKHQPPRPRPSEHSRAAFAANGRTLTP